MALCRTTTPSKMFQPRIKVVCVGLTRWSATELIRLVATFVKILKLTFSRQMGLYCWILFAFQILGNKIMTPKLRLNKGSCLYSPGLTSRKSDARRRRMKYCEGTATVSHLTLENARSCRRCSPQKCPASEPRPVAVVQRCKFRLPFCG